MCYDCDMLEEKVENKCQLQIVMGLKVDDKVLLFVVVSCFISQKGLDLVFEVLLGLFEQGGQLVLLGVGDLVLQEGFFVVVVEYLGKVGVQIGYYEVFFYCIMGGVDVILVLSCFEFCGLIQLYGLKYGMLLLVCCIGGLVDIVVDSLLENLVDGLVIGFVFEDSNVLLLLCVICCVFVFWLCLLFWCYVQCQVMNMDFSWQVVVNFYCEFY